MAHETQTPAAKLRAARAEAPVARSSADMSRFTAAWFAIGLLATLVLLLAAAYLAI